MLLSHDQHADNLDHAGRLLLKNARKVLTTPEGARRLGGNALGLQPWQSIDLEAPGGRALRVVATPARHGPPLLHRGPVIGFVAFFVDAPESAIYFSGDTVWYDSVAEVARRFPVRAALLNLGAARVAVIPCPLTMTAADAIQTARAFAGAAIVPLHFEGWAHFSEGRAEIARAFADAGLESRLQWPEAGCAVEIAL